MENSVLIGLGSNVPEKAEKIARAILWLKRFIAPSAETGPYPTKPDGEFQEASYINAIIKGRTPLDLTTLQGRFKKYELECGRKPEHHAEGRVIIDIDLVAFNDLLLKPEEYHSRHFREGLSILNASLLKSPSRPTE